MLTETIRFEDIAGSARAAASLGREAVGRAAVLRGEVQPDRHEYRAPGGRRLVGGLCTASVFAAVLAGSMLTLDWLAPPRPRVRPLTVLMLPAEAPAPKPASTRPKQTPKTVAKIEPRPTPPPLPTAPPTTVQVPVAAAPTLALAPPVPPAQPAPQQALPSEPTPPAERGGGPDKWEARLLARVQRALRFPEAEQRAHVQGTATVHFWVDRAGHVLTPSLEESSGSAALDQAALDTLRRADPLPKIPADRPDRIELSIPVVFHIAR